MQCVIPEPPLRPAQRLAIQTSRRWETKQLHVKFMGGDQRLHAYITELTLGLQGWNRCSGLQWVFDDSDDAEIRIGFADGPSWSQLGTDALYVNKSQPTMNLNILFADAGPHIDRAIGHEQGHAMGFVHGHQVEAAGALDLDAVYKYYRERGKTDEWIYSNVIYRYDSSDIEAIAGRDPSIMNYFLYKDIWEDKLERVYTTYPSYWDAIAAQVFYGDPPISGAQVFVPIAFG